MVSVISEYRTARKELRKSVLKAHNYKCSLCGRENHSFMVRDNERVFVDADQFTLTIAKNRDWPIYKTSLRLYHVDHFPWDRTLCNWLTVCQACMLANPWLSKKSHNHLPCSLDARLMVNQLGMCANGYDFELVYNKACALIRSLHQIKRSVRKVFNNYERPIIIGFYQSDFLPIQRDVEILKDFLRCDGYPSSIYLDQSFSNAYIRANSDRQTQFDNVLSKSL